MFKKVLFVLAILLSAGVGCYAGRMTSSLDLMNRDTGNAISDVDLGDIKVTSDTDIINILLLGTDSRDELGTERYGRSDTCMIATIDNKHKMLKLTSLMRDMEVEVPGYGYKKFNTAYAFGGPELVYKTIAGSFGVSLDGYAIVNFEAFKDIVDEVGGVDIELGEKEANYLNTTNYIRKKKYRNVVPGWNTLNGEQALGYCRVRKVPNVKGTYDDQGRTERQRMVMSAIFDKVKTMPMSKWMKIIDVVMPNVTTDLNNSQIISYATNVITMGTTKVTPYRIPVDGYYDGRSVHGNGSVLNLDLASNKQFLETFIYEYNGSSELPGIKKETSGEQ
jgi:LCP family protein required for cell wall assembly